MLERIRVKNSVSCWNTNCPDCSGHSKTEEEVVVDAFSQIEQDHMKCILFFVSSLFDQQRISDAIHKYCDDNPLFKGVECVGCTTVGEISSNGFTEKCFTAMSIASDCIEVGVGFKKNIRSNPIGLSKQAVKQAAAKLGVKSSDIDEEHYVGMLLVDGLQKVEEFVTLGISMEARRLRVVGGSAGDDLKLKKTFIHAHGEVCEDAMAVVLFKTDIPVEIVRIVGYSPTQKEFKITKSDLKQRIIYEFNGRPAADEYARALQLPVSQLDRNVFMSYPIGIRTGQEYWLRSPWEVIEDGALRVLRHIPENTRVTLMKPGPIIEQMENEIQKFQQSLGGISALIVFNSILRYHKFLQEGNIQEVNRVLSVAPVIGFNTYGEQFNGVHTNQAMIFLAFGK